MIKAIFKDGMINVDSDNINYTQILEMYKTGPGYGLQVNNENIRVEASDLCHSIADSLTKLNKLLNENSPET